MDEHESDELRREAIAMRRHRQKLVSHPDCRDPDHPGCDRCVEEETDSEDE